MRRDTAIRFRCTSAEKARIDAYAQVQGIETGRWLRELALRVITEGELGPPERHDHEPLKLSGGVTLGKSSFRPDPK